MIFRKTPLREPMDDVERHPRRGARPTPRAQWDEVHACWIEWDDDDGLWVHVETPSTRPRSTDASD